MSKKRIVFTLFMDEKGFKLSRNFRLQQVGNIKWLKENYKFENCSSAIDELIIIYTGCSLVWNEYEAVVNELTRFCFIPVCLGGQIKTMEGAQKRFEIGADKISLNRMLTENPSLVKDISLKYGSQSLVASVDYKRIEGRAMVRVVKEGGEEYIDLREFSRIKSLDYVGEILLTSIDRDGTGQGFDDEIENELKYFKKPIIIAGGAGKAEHLCKGLMMENVDAVSTANLFNFIGTTLPRTRKYLMSNGLNLADWG